MTNKLSFEPNMEAPKPLGEITNRVSLGVEKNRSYSNVMKKMSSHDSKTSNTGSIMNK